MNSAGAKDSKLILEQLRSLASQPSSRHLIVADDTYLAGIVHFLASPDKDIVLMAVQVIHYLSLTKELRTDLSKFNGLVAGVRKIMLDVTTNPNCKRLASEVYSNLTSSGSTTTGVTSTFSLQGLHANNRAAPGLSLFSSKVANRMESARTHTIFIPSLTTEEIRKKMEEQMLEIQGIISFMLDVAQHNAIIRAYLTTKDLLIQMKNAGIPNCSAPNEEANKENELDYLPEEEVNKKPAQSQASSGGWFSSIVSWGTVVPEKKKESAYKGSSFGNLFCSVGESLRLY